MEDRRFGNGQAWELLLAVSWLMARAKGELVVGARSE
jgi:hypothetical protein